MTAHGGPRILITASFVHALPTSASQRFGPLVWVLLSCAGLPSNIDLHDLIQSDAVLAPVVFRQWYRVRCLLAGANSGRMYT